ncbi:hypothetical protein Salat_0177100 [Sesamum alatum]|uniref:Secreted protein n=1 Tax=Sesamum alatum TaxID=300844 RepID=A0AAE1YYS3_9LAMI|nr:hypothetical protein Salat_0177100 [Sesamum alatum]
MQIFLLLKLKLVGSVQHSATTCAENSTRVPKGDDTDGLQGRVAEQAWTTAVTVGRQMGETRQNLDQGWQKTLATCVDGRQTRTDRQGMVTDGHVGRHLVAGRESWARHAGRQTGARVGRLAPGRRIGADGRAQAARQAGSCEQFPDQQLAD